MLIAVQVRLCAVYIAKGDNYVVVLDHDGNLKPNRDADAKMNDLYQDKILASILPELRNVSIIEALLRGSHPQRPKLFPAPELFLNVLQTPSASDILKIATPIKTAEKHRSEKVLGRAVSPSVTLCATRHPDEETHTTTVDVTEQTCWTSAACLHSFLYLNSPFSRSCLQTTMFIRPFLCNQG